MFEDLRGYCDRCNKTVRVWPRLMIEAELKTALADPKAEVWVSHYLMEADVSHEWKLNKEDKKNWLGRMQLGIAS
jgi:hypothetical protein